MSVVADREAEMSTVGQSHIEGAGTVVLLDLVSPTVSGNREVK